jgi:CHAT domain-containing protein
MAALHNGEHFLIEDYAIATTPGLDLTDPEPIAKKSPRVLMLALTQSTQGFPSLPYVSDELQNIKAIFPSKLLLNEDFRVAKMETALRDQNYAILHIASHAQFESEADKTFIVAYDGNVSVDNLSQYIGLLQFRDYPLELITLSACETAAGDDKAALGLAGIAIKAGARSALASLWHINDFATSKLVEKFYRGLKDPAGSKAKSLQSAQLNILNGSRFQHPGYWAPFILINNWL